MHDPRLPARELLDAGVFYFWLVVAILTLVYALGAVARVW